MQTKPVVNALQTEFEGRLQVVQLDFNATTNRRAIQALGVRVHPTLVFMDRSGAITRTWFGAATADELRPIVATLIAP